MWLPGACWLIATVSPSLQHWCPVGAVCKTEQRHPETVFTNLPWDFTDWSPGFQALHGSLCPLICSWRPVTTTYLFIYLFICDVFTFDLASSYNRASKWGRLDTWIRKNMKERACGLIWITNPAYLQEIVRRATKNFSQYSRFPVEILTPNAPHKRQ